MTTFNCRTATGERVTYSMSRAKSFHQTYLDFDPQQFSLAHVAMPEAARETLILSVSSCPEYALMIGSDGQWPEDPSLLGRAGWSPRFLPLCVIPMENEEFAFKRYGTEGFFTAEIGTERIQTDRTSIREWELFTLEPTKSSPPALMDAFAEQFAAILGVRHEAQSVLAALLQCPVSFQPHLLSAILAFLTSDVRKEFVALFVNDGQRDNHEKIDLSERFLSSLPEGRWIAAGLRQLHLWQSGQTRTLLNADHSFDFLGYPENCSKHSVHSLGGQLLTEARRMIKPTKCLALLATARDEGLYILEWIAHHRRIGVEQFFIYTNNLTDGSDNLLRILAEAGEIVWIDNTGASPDRINMQDKAYHHALTMVPELLDYRWCLIVDLDEMVLPSIHVDYRLPPLLSARESEGAEAVAISWSVLNPNKHLTWAPGLSAERFVQTERHPLIKTVFRTHLFSGSAAHHPTSRERSQVRYMTIDGERHGSGDLGDHEINFCHKPTVNAVICHYHVRSLEEYVWKFSRGENDGGGVLVDKHFRYNNPGIFQLFTSRFETEGAQPALPLADDIREEIRRLRALPGVAEAIKRIEERFLEQSVAFVEQSNQIMQADSRIAGEVRDKWRDLVTAWRNVRALTGSPH